MIKLEILGHVVQSFFRECMNVQQVHRLLYEQDEALQENNCLSTRKNTVNASKSKRHKDLL